MKRLIPFLITTMFLAALPAAAQSVPEIPFDSVANPLTLPDDIYLGEIGGVAANSKGDIFVYTRTGHPTVSLGTARPFAHGGSRLFQFDKSGKFVREIGANSYSFIFAQQVRIDPQDNIWIVDQMTNFVEKLDPAGHPQLLLGRKPEAIPVPAPRGDGGAGARGGGEGGGARGGGLPGAGAQSDVLTGPPMSRGTLPGTFLWLMVWAMPESRSSTTRVCSSSRGVQKETDPASSARFAR